MIYKRRQLDTIRDHDPSTDAILKLMGRLLTQARRQLKTADNCQRQQLMAWFVDPDESYIFSFASICNYLDLSRTRILEEILEEERGQQSACPPPIPC